MGNAIDRVCYTLGCGLWPWAAWQMINVEEYFVAVVLLCWSVVAWIRTVLLAREHLRNCIL